jgi:hypothetical protein
MVCDGYGICYVMPCGRVGSYHISGNSLYVECTCALFFFSPGRYATKMETFCICIFDYLETYHTASSYRWLCLNLDAHVERKTRIVLRILTLKLSSTVYWIWQKIWRQFASMFFRMLLKNLVLDKFKTRSFVETGKRWLDMLEHRPSNPGIWVTVSPVSRNVTAAILSQVMRFAALLSCIWWQSCWVARIFFTTADSGPSS